MCYNSFAYHYDKMMADVDYSWWIKTIEKNLPRGCRVLDVGCGTGTLSLALINSGYDVTGLDLSENMLVVANEKAKARGIMIDFIHRDMRELDGLSGFDCVLIAVDSLNYLETEDDVRRTFKGAYDALNQGGILIFDVHAVEKVETIFKDYLYVENDEKLTYIWRVEPGEDPLSIVHELTIFSRNLDGSYNRNIEYHYQRTYEFEFYEYWLVETGFEVPAIEVIEMDEVADRELFVAKKGAGESASKQS